MFVSLWMIGAYHSAKKAGVQDGFGCYREVQVESMKINCFSVSGRV